MWWNASEDGWGINFSHQGTTLFASWFTYDVDGSPLWLVSIMQKGTGETFSGDLLRRRPRRSTPTPSCATTRSTSAPPACPFANGNSGTFQYTIGTNATITKQLTHQPLGAVTAGTVCH